MNQEISAIKKQLGEIFDLIEEIHTYQDNVLLDLSSVSRQDLEAYAQAQYFKTKVDTSGSMFNAIEMHKAKMKDLDEEEDRLRTKKYELERKLLELQNR